MHKIIDDQISEELWSDEESDFYKNFRLPIRGFYNKYYCKEKNSQKDNDTSGNRWKTAVINFVIQVSESSFLLEYSSRKTIKEWFDEYYKETIDETDRPWDRDHIYPQSYVKGKRLRGKKQNSTYLVNEWGNTIGNIRYRPLDLNRYDGDKSPKDKLDFDRIDDDNLKIKLKVYGISKKEEIFIYSGMENSKKIISEWLNVSEDKDPKDKKDAKEILKPIINKIVHNYSSWYNELSIGRLFD